MVRILVGPVPLVAGCLYRDVGLRNALLLEQHRQRNHSDPHQNDYRNHRPRKFETQIVREFGRNGIHAAVVPHDHPKQQSQDERANRRDYVVEQPVQPVDVPGHLGNGRLEAVFVRPRPSDYLELLTDIHTQRAGCGGSRSQRRQAEYITLRVHRRRPMKLETPAVRPIGELPGIESHIVQSDPRPYMTFIRKHPMASILRHRTLPFSRSGRA